MICNNRGSALIAVLVVTSIVGIYLALTYIYLGSHLRLSRIEKFGRRWQFENELSFLSEAKAKPDSLICGQLHQSTSTTDSAVSPICVVNGSKTRLPLVDYAQVFGQISPCPSLADTMKNTCSITGSSSKNLIVKENIAGTSVSLTESLPKLIASPGQILVSGLVLASDVTIVAGEKIEIQEIDSFDATVRKVTLISARGTITVGKIGPNVSVLPLSRIGYFGPAITSNPPYPIPQTLPYAVIGRGP